MKKVLFGVISVLIFSSITGVASIKYEKVFDIGSFQKDPRNIGVKKPSMDAFKDKEYITIDRVVDENIKEIKGTVTMKRWSKNSESYCAGGSEYFFIRKSDKTEEVLLYSDKLKKYTNKKVMLKGVYLERAIFNSPYVQAPSGNKAACKLLAVLEIKAE